MNVKKASRTQTCAVVIGTKPLSAPKHFAGARSLATAPDPYRLVAVNVTPTVRKIVSIYFDANNTVAVFSFG